jgi:urease accessory protein
MEQLTGYLQLAVEKKRDKTIAEDLYFYGAFKLMSPFYLQNDAQACYYIMNPGGGYVDGDQYKIELQLSKKAELLLTTQSATKIYKTPNKPVIQDVNITLKEGALLEYLPDPIIGYRNSSYKQNTVVRMERGTCYIATDIITPGWDSEGQLFSYELLELKTKIYFEGNLAVLDHIRLMPTHQSISDIGFLEGYTHFGSLVVIGEKVDAIFLSRISDLLDGAELKSKFGLSMLTIPGFTLRVLGNSTQEVEKVFNLCHTLVRKEWFGKSPIFLRKY